MKSIVVFLLSLCLALPVLAGEKLCVTGDAVRMREGPSASAAVIRDLYWLNRFATARPVGQPVVIAGQKDQWYEVSYKECRPPQCADTEIKGYVFGAFLDSCEGAEKAFKSRLSAGDLAGRLMGRKLYGDERMLPDGKSTRKDKATGGCCNTLTTTTSYYTWKKTGENLEFQIVYDYLMEQEGTDHKSREHFKGLCVVTGLKQVGQSFQLLSSSSDPFCKKVKIYAQPVLLGTEGDE